MANNSTSLLTELRRSPFRLSSPSASDGEWTWWEPIRTISEVPLEFTIPITKTFLFQSLSDAARSLKEKGLSYLAISKILGIDDKTVKKAILRGKSLFGVFLWKL